MNQLVPFTDRAPPLLPQLQRVRPDDFAPLDHRVGVRLGQGMAGQLAGCAAVSLEETCLRIVRKAAPSIYSCR
jgi:hypothetical protein